MWFESSRFGNWNESFSDDSQAKPTSLKKQQITQSLEVPVASATPITHATDPRWILAQRTTQVMQGTVLSPEKRGRLIKLGKLLGLSPFDANVIIAIVQNKAREGQTQTLDFDSCELLSLIHPPEKRTPTKLNWFTVGVCVALLFLIETVFLLSWTQG